MKKSQAQRVVTKELARLRKQLALGDWDIDCTVGRCSTEGAVGESEVLGEYERLVVTVDHLRCDCDDDVRGVLRHELLHALLSDIDGFAEAVIAHVAEDTQLKRTFERLYERALERTITRLERTDIGREPAE